jgi:hypothetical protein
VIGSPSTSKRQVNEIMQDTLRGHGDVHPIAFFCECDGERCYQAVWLTGSEYDRARADPQWAALIPDHREEAAQVDPTVLTAMLEPHPATITGPLRFG